MNYWVDGRILPRSLRSLGIRVRIGDSVMKEQALQEQGMTLLSAFMLRDVYREVVILFTMPLSARATPKLATLCMRCALDWFSTWAGADTVVAESESVGLAPEPPQHQPSEAVAGAVA